MAANVVSGKYCSKKQKQKTNKKKKKLLNAAGIHGYSEGTPQHFGNRKYTKSRFYI